MMNIILIRKNLIIFLKICFLEEFYSKRQNEILDEDEM